MQIAYRSILLTLDGSPLAAQAIPHARHFATQFDAELTILRAVLNPAEIALYQVPEGVVGHTAGYSQTLLDEWMARANKEMDALAAQLRADGLNVTSVVEVGNPAAVILDYANNKQIDLLVMSTHGRSGPARWVYGSVAEKVLHRAPCPVCLVRTTEAEASAAAEDHKL